ncbi:MAG: Smr/MutS family protein [Burkholderiaceae bacterium]
MSAREGLKSFAELGRLHQRLRRQAADAERARQREREQAAQSRRDQDLFAQALAGVQPLKVAPRHPRPPPDLPPIARQHALDEAAALAESLSDEIDIERYLDTDDALSFHRPHLGPEVVKRLRRGEWTIKRQIDLHGLRVDQARGALAEFLAQALRAEHRCVRVIHGKGLGSINRQPVLKGKVLKWLIQRSEVLAFCQARPNDGGSGALIVLLQGRRSGG